MIRLTEAASATPCRFPRYISAPARAPPSGLVFFRAQSFGDAGTMLQHMFASVPGQALDVLSLTTVLGVLAIVFVGHLAGTFLDTRKWERRLPAPALGMGLAALVLLIFLFIPEDGKAFIYFQF